VSYWPTHRRRRRHETTPSPGALSAIEARGPQVQCQAVFADRHLVRRAGQSRYFGPAPAGKGLRRIAGPVDGLTHSTQGAGFCGGMNRFAPAVEAS
jgi:hypothetical protein